MSSVRSCVRLASGWRRSCVRSNCGYGIGMLSTEETTERIATKRVENRRQKTEVREQRTEDREQRTENRRQRTEVREQRTEDRRQRSNSIIVFIRDPVFCSLSSVLCSLTSVSQFLCFCGHSSIPNAVD